MLDAIRKLLLSIGKRAEGIETLRSLRRLAVMLVKHERGVAGAIEDISSIAEKHAVEVNSWLSPEEIVAGKGGRFDACSLRAWLAIAERAAVPAVPARVVLELSENEMSVASGTVVLPEGALRRRLGAKIRAWIEASGADIPEQDAEPDVEDVVEKLAAAMDEVPEGWMVRHDRCGPESLKALAGCGVAGPTAPEVRFGPELEVGPGWVRVGNRRRIDAGDKRFVRGYAEGSSGGPSVFLARPWVAASRWTSAEDPHRHGSRFAGKGFWPAEWRAFVENGECIGVSAYYAWAGVLSKEAAEAALKVRELARKLIDEVKAMNAIPSDVGVELLRDSPHFAETLARFPKDAIACTIDFIETKDGILLLEAGPAFSKIGGGHPCGFAGLDKPEGVAISVMPGVSLADPRTWTETDRTGRILSWEEIEAVAAA
jgi:hypothetical protein